MLQDQQRRRERDRSRQVNTRPDVQRAPLQ